tara:strand:+ start:289 stop:459 length:171 start_codon:yes stop_codon:yes gene_type:complete
MVQSPKGVKLFTKFRKAIARRGLNLIGYVGIVRFFSDILATAEMRPIYFVGSPSFI